MKRMLDITGSVTGIILLAPVFVLLFVIIRLRLGAPVFFAQVRPGRHGKPFKMLKFRSMADRRDAAGMPLPDEQRLTPFGRLLRATSLDELPELWNVLNGDMSLIGPRPLLMAYLPLYTPGQARRHEVRPGITGWAQVNGRNALSWEDRFALDVWYVDNQSMWLDIRILSMTVSKVLRRHGICQAGEATMSRFTGSAR